MGGFKISPPLDYASWPETERRHILSPWKKELAASKSAFVGVSPGFGEPLSLDSLEPLPSNRP